MPAHKAPWSTSLLIRTALISFSLVTGAAAAVHWGTWFLAPVLLGVLIGAATFAIRGYTITPEAILVHRPFWDTPISRQELISIEVDPEAMRRSLRTGGMDGLFATVGHFTNPHLGDFRAFVTDPARAVVLRFPQETLVLSPAVPEAFARELDRLRHEG